MVKRIQYTKIVPLPSNVPRQLAIELLHSHSEVIELNPLVTGVKAIPAPRDAPSDEYFSQWYEISEIITWGFGMKKKINFRGVFHDLPYGMQSHVYAPMGVDLRNKYRIGGNQPGEPRETRELGVETPLDGLYLREDVIIECNLALASFVKKETKEALGKMIERLTRKAELLDEGKLHAMFEDGLLKTKPAAYNETEGSVGLGSEPGSPSPSSHSTFSQARADKQGYGNYHDIARSASQHRDSQYLSPSPQQGYRQPEYARAGAELPGDLLAQQSTSMVNELPGSYEHPQQSTGTHLKPQGAVFRSELPGDMSFSTGTPPAPQFPRPQSSEIKAPVYQAYPPPTQQHPSARDSYSGSNSMPPPEQSQAQSSSSDQHRPSSLIAEWSRSVSRSQADASESSAASNIMPDHQRFSQLSVQQTPKQDYARPVPSEASAPGVVSSVVKCPVCGLFEGDAAAVSHHVSKAHFS